MKVYIVRRGFIDDFQNIAVFANEQDAKDFAASDQRHSPDPRFTDQYDFECFDVLGAER